MTGTPAAAGSEQPDNLERVRRVELIISRLLRTGVAVSLGLVICGVIVGVLRHPDYLMSTVQMQRLTQTGSRFPHSFRKVAEGLPHLRGEALILLGLLLLIATPVMRVAVSVFAFKAEGDKLYTRITLAVLFFLLLSFFLGRVE